MNFAPFQIRVVFDDNNSEIIELKNNEHSFEGQKIRLLFNTNAQGVVSPVLEALDDFCPNYLSIDFKIPENALGDELYYYYAAFTTNDITSIFQHIQKPKNDMKDVFLAKNKATGININIGLLTAHRFFTIIRLNGDTVSVHTDLECKPLVKGDILNLEKFIFGTENENSFLEKRYAPLVAKYNNAIPLESVPSGWCSWSCYYRNVDEEKITNCVEDITKIKGTDLFQIDDGWQFDGTFPGDWHIDADKFPKGLSDIIKKCNDAGITFGLWLSPFLVNENSRYYDEVKHLVRTDLIAGNSNQTNTIRPFDLDNPEFYKKLYDTYHYLSYEMGVKYYKLDFLIFGYFSFHSTIRFKSDYRSALFRKVIATIREAVGSDAIMLSCGSPIIECAGIFDAQRESRDIICPKSNGDPFYWQHWSNIKNASKTVLYRYFYNNVVFRNDPDGAVLRDYDIGDGFDCSYSEAKYWSTIVAFSGGLVLANDEIRNLSKPRQELFTKLLPPLGISGRAVDMFEYPAPTSAIIEASKTTKYIAKFNLSDKFENITVSLSDYGIDGEKLVFNCWDAKFVAKTNVIEERLVNPHNALMYMIKDIPTKPTFLYSNINLYLGENVFRSEYENGSLEISVFDKYKGLVEDNTRIYAYYPVEYKPSIGKTHKESIVIETEEYIITEYKI